MSLITQHSSLSPSAIFATQSLSPDLLSEIASQLERIGKATGRALQALQEELTRVDIVLPNGDRYQGGVQKNAPHGRGCYIFAQGGSYEGDWHQGMCHGQGNAIFATGERFVGAFVLGKKQGHGIYTFASGEVYNGNWANDLPHGTGKIQLVHRAMYQGEFVSGYRTDYGTYSFANGNRYVGYFKEGIPNGFGTLFFANGDKYQGGFENGEPHGSGSLFFANGNRYIGSFQDGEKNGSGTLFFANGDRYTGQFRNDAIYGEGTFISRHGIHQVGAFYSGKMPGEGLSEEDTSSMPRSAAPCSQMQKLTSSEKNEYLEPHNEEDRTSWYFFFHSLRMLCLPHELLSFEERGQILSHEAHLERQTESYWNEFLPHLHRWQAITIRDIDPTILSTGAHHPQMQQQCNIYGGGKNPEEVQKQYDRWYAQITQKVSVFLAGEQKSKNLFLDLLSILGYERHVMAMSTEAPISHRCLFGEFRQSSLRTIIRESTQRYAHYVFRFVEKFGDHRKDQELICHQGRIQESFIPLTTLKLRQKPRSRGLEESVEIIHSPSIALLGVSQRQLVVKYLQERFTQTFEAQEKEEWIRQIASLHFWLSHLTLFTRGSASISEILILAMFQSKGCPIQWKPKVLPDLEAMLYSEKEFIEKYPQWITKMETQALLPHA